MKTFDISGSISIAESCSGGCCQKKIQASDGVGSNDNEQVQRVGDSCYTDHNGCQQGYCGDIPEICSCSKGCSKCGEKGCKYCKPDYDCDYKYKKDYKKYKGKKPYKYCDDYHSDDDYYYSDDDTDYHSCDDYEYNKYDSDKYYDDDCYYKDSEDDKRPRKEKKVRRSGFRGGALPDEDAMFYSNKFGGSDEDKDERRSFYKGSRGVRQEEEGEEVIEEAEEAEEVEEATEEAEAVETTVE